MPKGEPLPALERTLYVVATPIGNLRDITLRALDILGQADVVAAEDTRVSAMLLAQYGIKARLLSLHQHNERERAAEVISLLASGKRIAVVTDAGTPGISDPGALLVRNVAAEGYDVVPIPGASAATAALSVAGIVSPHWLFYGFLPTSSKARKDVLESLRALPFALVFYEAPHRVGAAVQEMARALGGDRPAVVARELTKHFETIQRGTLADLSAKLDAGTESQRGEFVVIVDAPIQKTASAQPDADDAILVKLLDELPLAQAVRIAVALTGSPKNRLYARALELQPSERS
jgi:16S rRNA (cytidine1402-2'-O)-methyltransferase